MQGAPGWRPWEEPLAAPGFRLLLERVMLCRECPEADGRRFYAATAATRGLRRLLEAVADGLEGGGRRVLLVRAGRGWGKTHALAAVAHALGGQAAAPEPLRGAAERLSRARAAIAFFDGSSTGYRDIVRDYGLPSAWGLLAVRLSEAAGVGLPFDPRGPPPGAAAIAGLLGAVERRGLRPVILVDDADRYVEGVEAAAQEARGEEALRLRREAQHFLSFLSALSEAVAGSRHSVMVVTVTSGSAASRRVEEALGDYHAAPPPAEPGELAAILRARLVKSVDPGAAAGFARAYEEAYREAGLEVEGIPESYPFHPLLVEALRALVSGSPSHRGLASALAIAWRAAERSLGRGGDLVLPGDLDARDPSDLEALLPRGSGGLEGLRAAAERDAEAIARVDGELGARGLPPLASGIYAHLLLWSASGRALPRLLAAAGSAAPPRGVSLGDALEAFDLLLREAVHIHVESVGGVKGYIVKARANLEALVAREARRVLEGGEAEEVVREELERLLGRIEAPVEALVWPREPPGGGWPVRLAILGPRGPGAAEVLRAAEPRVNTVVVLEPDGERLGEALEAAARLVAVRRLLEAGEIPGGDEEEAERLAALLRSRLRESLALAYSRALYPAPGGFTAAGLSVERILSTGLWAAIREALVRAGKLAHDRLDPALVERLLAARGEARVADLVEAFARDPSLPILLDPWRAVESAVRRLVASGRAAVAGTERACLSDPGALQGDAVVLSCREAAARGLCIISEGRCEPPGARRAEAADASLSSAEAAGRGEPRVISLKAPPSRLAAALARASGFRVESLRLSLRGSGLQGLAAARALLAAVEALGAGRAYARARVEAVPGSAKAVVEASGEPRGVAEALRGARALGEVAGVEVEVIVEGVGLAAERVAEALARSPLRLYRAPQALLEARLTPSS